MDSNTPLNKGLLNILIDFWEEKEKIAKKDAEILIAKTYVDAYRTVLLMHDVSPSKKETN